MYRSFEGRLANQNAISNGIAVAASATLCIVSPSNATDPVKTTTNPCNSAVTANAARLVHNARRPRASASNASST